MTVTQYSGIVSQELLRLFDYVNQNFSTLSQKNLIALGLIAQHEKISSIDLIRLLQLSENDRLRSYVEALVSLGIIQTRGIKKGTQYVINPHLVANAGLNTPTTLKSIEPHRLCALIIEDLKYHPLSSITEIAQRLPDVERKDIKKHVYNMAHTGELITTGNKTTRRYTLPA